MNEALDNIYKASRANESKTIQQITLKLMEEMGEVAEALLSYDQAPGCGYKGKSLDDLKEEIIDVIIVSFVLTEKLGMEKDEIKEILNRKVAKWIEKSKS